MAAASSLEDVYSSIKAGLEMLKREAASNSDVPSKQALVQAAERIKADAAKIGLMCSGSTPPEDQLLSLASGLQQSCTAFCSLVHSLTAAAGPTLRGELVKVAQGLTNPCLVLVKEMASGKDLKPHVGAVWAGMTAASKTPADNKACVFQHLAAVLNVLKDTMRELEELEEQQQKQFGDAGRTAAKAAGTSEAAAGSSANAGAAGTSSSSSKAAGAATGKQGAAQEEEEDESGSCDPDLDYEAEEMSAVERQLLGSCLQLLQASAGVLKAFGKALLQGPALQAGTDGLDSWESCLFHARHLRRQAEDLGAAMYPAQVRVRPRPGSVRHSTGSWLSRSGAGGGLIGYTIWTKWDFDEVASASDAVFTVAELMLDECPHADAVGQQQLSSLAAQLAAAQEHLQQQLRDAQQSEMDEAAAAARQQQANGEDAS